MSESHSPSPRERLKSELAEATERALLAGVLASTVWSILDAATQAMGKVAWGEA